MPRPVLAIVLSITAVGCGVPAPTPSLSPSPAASGLMPTSTPPPPTAPSDSPTPGPDDNAQIVALVDAMESAVLAGDRESYLALVDLSDPVFATEHSRFADDWIANPPSEYDLAIADVVVDGSAAIGELSVTWANGADMRSAQLSVRFTRHEGTWLYAGEEWITQEVEHFLIHVAPGLEDEMPTIAESLPDIYEYVTTHFAWIPTNDMEIKVYTGPAELVAMTWLSLPDIRGWNEPGESLKLQLGPDESPTSTIAHEFTHFLEFDRAGTQRSRMPWWLSEGIASFFGYHFDDTGVADFQLNRVREWAANGELADWDAMAIFEKTPRELWTNVYAQGYVFVAFVTDIYGEAERNRWLAAMAIDSDLAEATQDVLGLSFADLDAQFVEWLSEG